MAKGEDKYNYYLALLISVFTVSHFVINIFLGVHIDEANWWLASKHLAPGYFFHPPFIAYELMFITKIFGDKPYALRLGSLLLTCGSLLLFYYLSLELFREKKWAFFSVLIFSLLPITNYWLMIGNQDAPFIFFWLSTLFLVWRAIGTEKRMYWYLAGLSAGLLMLCKLQSALIFPCLLLFLATSQEHRVWLKRKEPYLAFLMVVAMFLPTLVWYARHQFEPIVYQLTSRPGFIKHGAFDYLLRIIKHVGWEMVALSPFIYLLSLFGAAYGGYLAFKRKDTRFLYLFWISAPIIAFFTITGGPPYWSFPGHLGSLLAAIGALPILLFHLKTGSLSRWRRAAAVALCMAIPLAISSFTIYSALTDSILHNGWEELADKIYEERSEMGSQEVYLAGPYHFIVNGVAYYERERVAGYTLLFRVYETENFGVDTSYPPWVSIANLTGKDIVFMDEKNNPDGYETPLSYWVEKMGPYFESIEEPEIFQVEKNGKTIRTFYIFKCFGFKGAGPDMDIRGDIRTYLSQLEGK